MFKELLKLFKQDSLMIQAFQQTYQMLDITREMFTISMKSLRESNDNNLSDQVYQQDVKVNKFEREVRKNVLIHLTVNGNTDLTSALILISIIIDVERIGDYTKNIVELAQNHSSKLEGGIYNEDLVKIEQAVVDTFKGVRFCFENGDGEKASELLEKFSWVNKLCDQHVIDYLNERDKTISNGSAVTLALYFRYLKRVNSHLRNILTSVVNPFHRIGFVKKNKDNKDNK